MSAGDGSSGLRVALVCPYSLSRPGGVQGQVVGLARALDARGHQPTVFAPLDDPGDAPSGIDLVVSGHSVSLPANGSVAPVSVSPLAVGRALRALRAGHFDVVHVHEPFSPGLPYGLLVAKDIPPEVATFHRSGGSLFYTALRPLTTTLARRRFALRCAVSEAARETAHAAVGGDYVVLFNGVEVDRYANAEPWPTTGPTALFLGRHEERKGLQVLLDAFTQLARDPLTGDQLAGDQLAGDQTAGRTAAVSPTLWVAGDGPDTESLRRRYPDSPAIHWLGLLSEEEKLRRLAGADVLCAPSLGGESFGMVLLEAMAAGTPVIASDIPGYRDAAGGRARLVRPGDAPALADALRAVLGPVDEAEAHRRRQARADGTARAREWSMDRLAEHYESLYRGVTQPGEP
ncbi:MAG TPA: glycosyltransferase family 4 protein [Acidimicrobiales bacterium]|nr:glycosyltransferase family 4 protein [Acidimicrobiales bacterium]